MTTNKPVEMATKEAIRILQEVKERSTQEVTRQCMSVALNSMEKQMPKKPKGSHTNYRCPVCGRRVRSGKGSSSYGKRDNFCQRCGQKLDWNEGEDNDQHQ